MPTPVLITDLTVIASTNSPAGSEAPSGLDDIQRAHAAFIAQLRDGKGFSKPVTLVSAATTDIGLQSSLAVDISGTTTITSFGLNYNGPRFLRFTGALLLTHNVTTLNLAGGANITTTAGDSCIAYPNAAASGWLVVAFTRAAGYASIGELQAQTFTAFTTAGTATAYTLTPSPAITAYTAGQRFRIKVSVTNGLASTLAVSGLAATGLRVYDGAGNKVAPSTASMVLDMLLDIEHDGTHWVILSRLPLNSEVSLHGANSFGSTNLAIGRMINATTTGSDITYADSATLGATLTANVAGKYAVTYTAAITGSAYAGISLNSSQLTTGIQLITAADRKANTVNIAGEPACAQWTGQIAAGGVIRMHRGASAGDNGFPERATFTMTRVG